MMLHQPLTHPHYPGALPHTHTHTHTKSITTTASIIATSVCLQLPSRPDEALKHQKRCAVSDASQSHFLTFLWVCQTRLREGRGERRVSASHSIPWTSSASGFFWKKRFVVRERVKEPVGQQWQLPAAGSSQAPVKSSVWFLIKERGFSSVHPTARLCFQTLHRSGFNYLLWEWSSRVAALLGLLAGRAGTCSDLH